MPEPKLAAEISAATGKEGIWNGASREADPTFAGAYPANVEGREERLDSLKPEQAVVIARMAAFSKKVSELS